MVEKKYGEKEIESIELKTWNNPNKEDYIVNIELPEFMCRCPRSGYPDFATIRVSYIPNEKVVELKSIKLYINSYINMYISHEDATNKITKDLIEVLDPKWIRVVGDFNRRGNVKTVVIVEKGDKELGKWACSVIDSAMKYVKVI